MSEGYYCREWVVCLKEFGGATGDEWVGRDS